MNSPITPVPVADQTGEIDANYLFRGKIHYLATQNVHFSQQLQLSDAKAATLVTLLGVFLANVLPDLAAPREVVILFVLLCAASIIASVIAVVPRVPGAKLRKKIGAHDRFSWPGLSNYDGADYCDFLIDADADDLITSLTRSNAALARLLMRKFRMLRLGFGLAGVAVLVYLTSLIVPLLQP